MATVTMDVRELTRPVGVVNWVLDAETEDGDAAGAIMDPWLFPNDGKTFILVYADGGAGDTLTFTTLNDKYGRAPAVTTFVVATGLTGMVGPFAPALWNNAAGQVQFHLTAEHNASKLLAVRIVNEGLNGV